MNAIQKHSFSILLLFHAIGIILFVFFSDAKDLSYVNLLVTGFVLIVDERMSMKKWLILFLIFISAFLIEYIGVHSGLLFGNYSYGSALGYKINGIPLIIGLNWVIIVAASSSIAKKVTNVLFMQAIIAGILCTGIDFLLEPVAIKYDFWSWYGGSIPIFNYICWFIFSVVFAMMYLSVSKGQNKSAQSIYLIWVVFFLILNFI